MDGYKRLTTESADAARGHATFAVESPPYENRNGWISKRLLLASLWAVFILGAAVGFGAGVFLVRKGVFPDSTGIIQSRPQGISSASRISIPNVELAFVCNSSFSKEPPTELQSGQVVAEPIWDVLIPNGLGYFKDPDLAPEISIPTVFHQFHCLYTLRRAFYSNGDELKEFDFGRDRRSHVAHCFDYLAQGLSCLADSTVEPAIDNEHGFLGAGLRRQCRNLDSLKRFVEERRVFNASGFLAHGLDHGNFNASV